MPVLNTTSPVTVAGKPKAWPGNTAPSASRNRALRSCVVMRTSPCCSVLQRVTCLIDGVGIRWRLALLRHAPALIKAGAQVEGFFQDTPSEGRAVLVSHSSLPGFIGGNNFGNFVCDQSIGRFNRMTIITKISLTTSSIIFFLWYFHFN